MGKDVKCEINQNRIDWMITIVPLFLVCAFSLIFFFEPEVSNSILGKIRFFFR